MEHFEQNRLDDPTTEISSNAQTKSSRAANQLNNVEKLTSLDTHTSISSSQDKPHLSSVTSWTSKVLQFEYARRVASVVAPDHAAPDEDRPWRKTVMRFGPLSGFFCMTLAIGSIIASLGILAGSNGQPVASWSSPPATYLAIFTATANLSMRYAAIQGVIVTWWLRALRGSALGNLHRDWRAGTSIRGAVVAGRKMGLLGLASIFSTLVVIDGPLLQRASIPVSKTTVNDYIPLRVLMAQEIPRGFTGVWNRFPGTRISNIWNDSIPTNNGNIPNDITPAVPQGILHLSGSWWAGSPILDTVRGCPARTTCKAKIRAPALHSTVCKSHLIPADWKASLDSEALQANRYAPPLAHDVFMVDISLDVRGHETINLITGYATTEGSTCQGNFNYTVCTLESAIGEYDVTIQGGEITSLNTLGTPTIVAIANNTAVNSTLDLKADAHDSTLAGIVTLMYGRWGNVVTLFGNPLPNNGTSPDFLAIGSAGYSAAYIKPHQEGKWCTDFEDPHDDVLRSLNVLAFYIGAYAAKWGPTGLPMNDTYLETRMDKGLPLNSTIAGQSHVTQDVFHTDYWFFLGAALVEIVCIGFVLPTYWNFWRLGRPVSFSPLELAKAFESPMLSHSNSNSTGRDIAKDDIDIRYGTAFSGEKTKLAFRPPVSVIAPTQGMRFDL